MTPTRVRAAGRVGEDPGHPPPEAHGVGPPAPVHFDVHAGAERIDHARAHAVQPPGGPVGAAPELAPGVELGVDQLDAGQARGGLDVDGNPAAGVAHLDGAVVVHDDVDAVPVALQGLVDAVVDDSASGWH